MDLSLKIDTCVTIVKMFTTSITNLINSSITIEYLNLFLEINCYLYSYVRRAYLPKTFYRCNCNDLKRHIVQHIGQNSAFMFDKAIKCNMITDKISIKFIELFYPYLLSLNGFKCYESYPKTIEIAVQYCKSILQKCIEFNESYFGIKLLQKMLQNRLQLSMIFEIIDDTYILSTLTKLLQTDMIKYSEEYLYISTNYVAHMLTLQSDESKKIEYFMYNICKQQLSMINDNTAEFETISKYCQAPSTLSEISQIIKQLSSTITIDKVQLLTLQFQIYIKFNLLSTQPLIIGKFIDEIFLVAEQQNKLIDATNILYDMNSKDIQFISIDKMELTLNKLIEKFKTLSITDQLRVILFGAAVQINKYLHEYDDFYQKYKDVAVSFDLNSDNIFYQTTIEYEINLIKLLDSALINYKKFVNIILNRFDINQFNNQIEHVINMLKILIDHYTLRGYLNNSMETAILLYKISTIVSNDFGQITAVNYIAENVHLFNNKQEQENDECQKINDIIDNTSKLILKLMKEFSSFSRRKQNLLLYCILSIALYYHTFESNISMVKQLLIYVDKVINDSTLSSSTNMQLNSVRSKYYYILFHTMKKSKCNHYISSLEFTNYINNEIKLLKCMTYEDTIMLPTILFNYTIESCYYALYRYDIDGLNLILTIMLKFAQRIGGSYRCSQLITLFSYTDIMRDKKSAEVRFF